jgi:PST family polysaccharide transporter
VTISDKPLQSRHIKRAFFIAYCQRILSFLLGLGSTAILARLLDPTQFGYVAMALSALNLLVVFRDFGLTSAAIQRENLSIKERDALFWMNAGIVILVSLVAVSGAPLVAAFYGQAEVTPLMQWAAVGFLVTGLGAQHVAILRRRIALGRVFIAEIGGLLAGTACSIAIAFYYRTAMSIVFGTLVQGAVTTLAYFLLDPWYPKWDRTIKSELHLLKFGSNVAVFNILNYLTNNIGLILIGYRHGASASGQYNRAQSLYYLPVSFIVMPYMQVQFPMMCKEASDPVLIRRRYLGLIRLTSILFTPAALVLPFVSNDLVNVVLGPQWQEAGTILAWFAPAMGALGLIGPFGFYMMALARVSELRWWGVGDLIIRGGGAVIGSFLYGAVGTAAGFSLATLLVATPIIVAICGRRGPVSVLDQLKVSVPGVVCGLLAATGAVVAKFAVIPMLTAPTLFMVVGLILGFSFLGWLVGVATMEPSRKAARSLLSKRVP